MRLAQQLKEPELEMYFYINMIFFVVCRRAKAAWEEYYARELVLMKEEVNKLQREIF